MELGELVAIGFINEEMLKCPFLQSQEEVATQEEPEGIKDDDMDAAQREQENNGGTLGENLSDGKPGAKGTVGGPYPPDGYLVTEKARDSKPDRGGVYVKVAGAEEFDDDIYPFIMAAHHLIPGEASLAPSKLKKFMVKGETVQSASGKSWKIACYIGYNVNGAHNGIWLPGNYAIRKPTKSWYKSPDSLKSWSDLDDHKWCMHYVAAVSKVTGRQFHDAHTEYSDSVEKLLNKIATKLHAHQEQCKECEKKNNKEIAPPYFIKQRLYNISGFLRRQLVGAPDTWKRPWYTSDKWRDKVFSPAGGRISLAFLEAYDAGKNASK
ncbi:MAG TPA: AHH domain-containing protein [Cellvibrio sp.]|nr:AHH domain-containing protein [Cellvibrio sp.]